MCDTAGCGVQVGYNFTENIFNKDGLFPKELRPYIPNTWAKMPKGIGTLEMVDYVMKGVVFVTMRPIKDGEELLMDYRLRPGSDVPPWYEHYDIEQAMSLHGMYDEMVAAGMLDDVKESITDSNKEVPNGNKT